MTTRRWSRIQEIFLHAVDLPTREREDYLDRVCGDDSVLQQEVRALLAFDGGSSLIAGAVVDAIDQYDRSLQSGDVESMLGRRIGPYRLTGILGRGGMGAVYRAIRDDDHFEQEVAIKLVKRGMDTDFMLSRFRAERQIMARLEHPNIGRLLDGGATEDGLPYVVMELIYGKPITDHCIEKKLPIRDRIQLFRAVCSAVQYAHQNLVVHRDLKPSNILVTSDGMVKLLDFGIAKLLQPESLQLSAGTLTGMRMLTPDYASPEQIRGGVITTATDIYSLGVILYELLTERRPHSLTSQSPVQIEKTICQSEPERPSVAVGRSVNVSDRQRQVWVRALEGDLDNIILKAMRKEPQRRYASAEQFSEDLRRHLAGLPVQARQDSVGYRAGKFVQRNKAAVAAVTVLMLTLVGGITASAWQARRAERRFQEVRKLANTVLFDFHEKIRDLPGTTEAQQLLVETVAGYLDRLVREAGSDPTLEFELAEAYRKVGDAQGDPTGPNRGQTSEALKTYRKALALAERVFAREPQNVLVRRSIIESHYRIGDLELRAGQPARAKKSFETGLALAEQAYAAGIRAYDDVRLVAFGYNRVGDVQLDTGRVSMAFTSFSKAAAIARTAETNSEDLRQRLVSVAEFRLADAQAARGDLLTASRAYQQLLTLRRSLAEQNPANMQFQRDYVRVLCFAGDLLGSPDELNLGNTAAATENYRRAAFSALQISERDPQNARARRDLVFTYRRLARSVEATDVRQAVTLWREAIALMEPLLEAGPNDREFRYDQSLNRAGLGHALLILRDLSGARTQLEQSLAAQRDLAAEDPASVRFGRAVARTLRLLAQLEEEAGHSMAARDRLLEAARLNDQLIAGSESDARVLADAAATDRELGAFWLRRARSLKGEASRQAWQDARFWFEKESQIWRNWSSRAVAGPYLAARQRESALALAKCDHALGSLRASLSR